MTRAARAAAGPDLPARWVSVLATPPSCLCARCGPQTALFVGRECRCTQCRAPAGVLVAGEPAVRCGRGPGRERAAH